jgi:hypothetical protein
MPKSLTNFTLGNQTEVPYSNATWKKVGAFGLGTAIPVAMQVGLGMTPLAPFSVPLTMGGSALAYSIASRLMNPANSAAMGTGSVLGSVAAPYASEFTNKYVMNPAQITEYVTKAGKTLDATKLSPEMKGEARWAPYTIMKKLNLDWPIGVAKEQLPAQFDRQLRDMDAALRHRFGTDIFNEKAISFRGLEQSANRHVQQNYEAALKGLADRMNRNPGSFFDVHKRTYTDDWRRQLDNLTSAVRGYFT